MFGVEIHTLEARQLHRIVVEPVHRTMVVDIVAVMVERHRIRIAAEGERRRTVQLTPSDPVIMLEDLLRYQIPISPMWGQPLDRLVPVLVLVVAAYYLLLNVVSTPGVMH